MTIELDSSLLIPALWLIWGLYWWIAARRGKAVARKESVPSRLAHAIPLAVSAVLLALPSFPGWLGERYMARSSGAYVIAVATVVAGLLLCVWARIALGGNWSGVVTLKEGHSIVRTGPYRLIRHPIYTGLLLMFTGTALARGEWLGVLALVIAAVALWRKLRLEERWLAEHFGAAYMDYRKASWALVPFVL